MFDFLRTGDTYIIYVGGKNRIEPYMRRIEHNKTLIKNFEKLQGRSSKVAIGNIIKSELIYAVGESIKDSQAKIYPSGTIIKVKLREIRKYPGLPPLGLEKFMLTEDVKYEIKKGNLKNESLTKYLRGVDGRYTPDIDEAITIEIPFDYGILIEIKKSYKNVEYKVVKGADITFIPHGGAGSPDVKMEKGKIVDIDLAEERLKQINEKIEDDVKKKLYELASFSALYMEK